MPRGRPAGRTYSIVHWTDPGPGGFYDDLGNVMRQPHLVHGVGFEGPRLLQTPRFGYMMGRRPHRPSPAVVVGQRRDALRRAAKDAVRESRPARRVCGPHLLRGRFAGTKIRLTADDKYEIHRQSKPRPIAVVQYDIPPEATRDGKLTLTWRHQAGLGGNGRGCAVAEVWLIKKPL